MSAKSILEADGKAILNYHLTRAPVIKSTPLPASATHNPSPKLASIYFPEGVSVTSVLDQAESTYPWLFARDARFVAKPDQLIKRRGKSGLLALNKTWPEAREWIEARAGKTQQVETVQGVLRQFLVEPFVPHPEGTEYYININSVREVSCAFLSLFLSLRFYLQLLKAETIFFRLDPFICMMRMVWNFSSVPLVFRWLGSEVLSRKSSPITDKGKLNLTTRVSSTSKTLQIILRRTCIPIPSSRFHLATVVHTALPVTLNSSTSDNHAFYTCIILYSTLYLPTPCPTLLTNMTRAIGSCSHTRVVSMSVMSTPRLRKYLSQSTYPNTHRTRPSQRHY